MYMLLLHEYFAMQCYLLYVLSGVNEHMRLTQILNYLHCGCLSLIIQFEAKSYRTKLSRIDLEKSTMQLLPILVDKFLNYTVEL
jgi:hypothetical protein